MRKSVRVIALNRISGSFVGKALRLGPWKNSMLVAATQKIKAGSKSYNGIETVSFHSLVGAMCVRPTGRLLAPKSRQ